MSKQKLFKEVQKASKSSFDRFNTTLKNRDISEQNVDDFLKFCINSQKLKVTFPKGSHSNSENDPSPVFPGIKGGFPVENLALQNSDETNAKKPEAPEQLTLMYQFKFLALSDDVVNTARDPFARLPWIKGGKLPGLRGGIPVSGGNAPAARAGDGFSFRPMWRGDGRIELYAYYAGMNSEIYGERIGTSPSGILRVDTEYQITLKVDVGSTTRNGSVVLTVDPVVKVARDAEKDTHLFVTENKSMLICRDTDLEISHIHLSIFYGGAAPEWSPYHEQELELWDFKLTTS